MSTQLATHQADAWDGGRILLEQVQTAVAVCTEDGVLVGASPLARELLCLASVAAGDQPCELPAGLWRELCGATLGQAIEWWPDTRGDSPLCLGCARYRLGSRHHLLLMRELSDKHKELSQRLHQQRLEVTGTLVATIAHDLRTPLTSILFNATSVSRLLAAAGAAGAKAQVEEILAATDRLRATVDGLLEFARMGPPTLTTVDLGEVTERVSGFVRPVLRESHHVLTCHIAEGARYVSGSALLIEQILINLIVNAAQAASEPIAITLTVFEDPDESGGRRTCIRVCDDGPGIPPAFVHRIFEPFFTTKGRGTGLGLSTARDAARNLGGDLSLEHAGPGACFRVHLRPAPSSEGP